MNIALTLVSGNSKTGPIPVSTSNADTCPDACAFKATKLCYAKLGPLALHWNRLNNGTYTGLVWEEFLHQIRRFRRGQLWRHNQAGDLAGLNNEIDTVKLAELTAANSGKLGWTYTHKPVVNHPANAQAIKTANENGFTVNLSADNLAQADQLLSLKIGPVVVVVGADQVKNCKTPNGARVVICPAAIRDNVDCAHCGLCQWAKRDYAIAFPAHGVKKKAVTALVTA